MLRAAAAVAAALEHSMASPAAASPGHGGANGPAPGPGFPILQPGTGRAPGTYVPARAGDVFWGQLPNRASQPVAVVSSGSIVTLDTISHEGVLEDQGQDPVDYFTSFGVPRRQILNDAVRVPYGVVSNREGKGALPGEYPEAFRGVPA
ncbi:hypothetical protein BH24ACT11_BH24ACT11_09130 [soil metagenome]|jgi:hypothetical protein